MTVDFKALEEALAGIETLANKELTFDIAGVTSITMRQMSMPDEVAVQRYAQQAMADQDASETDRATFSDYLDRFKVGTCAYAIVAIGPHRLDGQTEFPTGKKTADGKSITVSRMRYIRAIVEKWPRPWVSAIFRKYGEIVTTAELDVSKAIEFAPVDLDTEITALEGKLEELREQRDAAATANQDTMTEHIKDLVSVEEAQAAVSAELAERARTPVHAAPVAPEPVAPEPVQAAPTGPRQPITPTFAPPPAQVSPAPVPPPQPQAVDEGAFVDLKDPDSLAAAMEAESMRWAAHRNKATASQAVATADGAEIIRPVGPPPNPAQVVVNQQGHTSSVNPNYRPPR